MGCQPVRDKQQYASQHSDYPSIIYLRVCIQIQLILQPAQGVYIGCQPINNQMYAFSGDMEVAVYRLPADTTMLTATKK
jgi:hypothetical protein